MSHQNIQSERTENLGENRNPLTFGNFQTQLCGAMSMGLLASQSEIAKTGAKIATEFTTEQKASYKGQSEFLAGAYRAAYNSAYEQAMQMHFAAGSEFASAGLSILSFVAPQMWKTHFSQTSKQLDNAQNKLSQLEHMRDLAMKEPRLTGAQVTAAPQQAANADPARARMIEDRQAKLAAGEFRKELTPDEKNLFPQPKYDPSVGYDRLGAPHYYNENATAEEVNAKTATRGAYHIDGLDQEAIEGLNDANANATTKGNRTSFIEKLEAEIKSTKIEVNTYTNELQRHTQLLQEISGILKSGASGAFQFPQAAHMQGSKEWEAQATLANNSGSIAGGVAQNANQAKEGAFSAAQNAMQSFGRVYDGMRG